MFHNKMKLFALRLRLLKPVMVQAAKQRLILLLLPEWADTEKFGRVTEWESAEWQI